MTKKKLMKKRKRRRRNFDDAADDDDNDDDDSKQVRSPSSIPLTSFKIKWKIEMASDPLYPFTQNRFPHNRYRYWSNVKKVLMDHCLLPRTLRISSFFDCPASLTAWHVYLPAWTNSTLGTWRPWPPSTMYTSLEFSPITFPSWNHVTSGAGKPEMAHRKVTESFKRTSFVKVKESDPFTFGGTEMK